MVRLAAEQEGLRGQLRDTQTLLAALQGLTAKQFQVGVRRMAAGGRSLRRVLQASREQRITHTGARSVA